MHSENAKLVSLKQYNENNYSMCIIIILNSGFCGFGQLSLLCFKEDASLACYLYFHEVDTFYFYNK